MGISLLEKARVGRVAALEMRRIPEAEPPMALPRTALRLVDPILPPASAITNVFADLDDDPAVPADSSAPRPAPLSFAHQRVLRASS
jgi:hypothetical protein